MLDYRAGKQDWLAAGLPTEGRHAELPRAADVALPDVPTISMDDQLSEAREKAAARGWNTVVVINDERVVMGLLRSAELERDDDVGVVEAMRPGPSTFRPHVAIEEMARFMLDHDLESSPITTSDGRLVGLLSREDAVRVARELRRDRRHDGESPPGDGD